MAKVKDLVINIKYTVGLGDWNIPDNVLSQLKDAESKGKSINMNRHEYLEANEWLTRNVTERDSVHWEADVEIDEY